MAQVDHLLDNKKVWDEFFEMDKTLDGYNNEISKILNQYQLEKTFNLLHMQTDLHNSGLVAIKFAEQLRHRFPRDNNFWKGYCGYNDNEEITKRLIEICDSLHTMIRMGSYEMSSNEFSDCLSKMREESQNLYGVLGMIYSDMGYSSPHDLFGSSINRNIASCLIEALQCYRKTHFGYRYQVDKITFEGFDFDQNDHVIYEIVSKERLSEIKVAFAPNFLLNKITFENICVGDGKETDLAHFFKNNYDVLSKATSTNRLHICFPGADRSHALIENFVYNVSEKKSRVRHLANGDNMWVCLRGAPYVK